MGQRGADIEIGAMNFSQSQRATFDHIVNFKHDKPIVLCGATHGVVDTGWSESHGHMVESYIKANGSAAIYYDPAHGQLYASPFIPHLDQFMAKNLAMRCAAIFPNGTSVTFDLQSVANAQLMKVSGAAPLPNGTRPIRKIRAHQQGEMPMQPRSFSYGIVFPSSDELFSSPASVCLYGNITENDFLAKREPEIDRIEVTKDVAGYPLVVKYVYELGGSAYVLKRVHVAGRSTTRQVPIGGFLAFDEHELSVINATPGGNGRDRLSFNGKSRFPDVHVRESTSEWVDQSGVSRFFKPGDIACVLIKLLFVAIDRDMASSESEIPTAELRIPERLKIDAGSLVRAPLSDPNSLKEPSRLRAFTEFAQKLLSEMP